MRELPSKIINLDMYGSEFRKGYDASSLNLALRESLLSTRRSGQACVVFLKIQIESLALCQGICSENMVSSKAMSSLPNELNESIHLDPGETWLRLTPNVEYWI